MSAISLGQSGMIEQASRRGWSPERGTFTTRVWHGPKSAVPGLELQLRQSLYEYDVQYEAGPNAIVSGRISLDEDGTTEVAIDTWERHVNRVEKDIYQSPNVAALGRDSIVAIKVAFESNAPDLIALLTADEGEVFDLLQLGVDTYIVEAPVVRLTETVSSRFVPVAKANIGRILTVAQMASAEHAPAQVLDTIAVPAGLAAFSVYGYRKGQPTITQQAAGKWQIVTEWEAGFWSTFLYDAAT